MEQEDSRVSVDEGLSKAVSFLKPLIMAEPKLGAMSWVSGAAEGQYPCP